MGRALSPVKATTDRHFVTWTHAEDLILRQAVARYGEDRWSAIASQFSNKTARQCRRRWHTYLSTDCKKGGWTPEEDRILLQAHQKFGNRWTEIAKVVPGRTDNAVKNRFCALGKKQSKKPNVSFKHGGAEHGKLALKQRVLEQNHNITNKRTREEDIQLMSSQSIHREQRQCNLQLKTWPSDQRTDQRAQATHLYSTQQTASLSIDGHEAQFSSKITPCVSTSITRQGSGSFSDNISPPRLAALTRTAALLDSLVERRDARLKLWGNIDTDDTWKCFDRLMIEGGNSLQANSDQDRLSLDNIENALYHDKENYPKLSQSPCDSSILLSVHDNEWYQRVDSDCCGSDHSSIRYDIMMDDHDGECATLENDPLFSDQVDQTIPIDDYGFELGFASITADRTSPATSNSGTIPSLPQVSWDSHLLMDAIPILDFSDTEKQFLLSAFDADTSFPNSLYA